MSGSLSGPCLPPSSTLPPVRKLPFATEEQITSALRNLQILYCPFRFPVTIIKEKPRRRAIDIPVASTPIPADSGYASQDEDEDDDAAYQEVTADLRADPFERTFATRWLTSLLARTEEMNFDEAVRARIVDDAAFILSSFSDSANDDEEKALKRDFSFPTSSGDLVQVTLNDAPLSGTDHTDVGLQSWGASIVLSSMMCADPRRFDLTQEALPDSATMIELGAGTGLVSLTLAKLFSVTASAQPRIIATDFHPAVLENCRANVETNFPSSCDRAASVETTFLDWSAPPPDLRCKANLLIASDVVYAPEHAAWLRDCAAHLLAPKGTFWLMVTVRKTGKFEGIPETVEAAFAPELCWKDDAGRKLRILEKEQVKKRKGIGRGDEKGYTLYRIGWA